MKKCASIGQYGLRFRMYVTKTMGVGKTKWPLRYYVSVYKWNGNSATDVYGWEGVDFRNVYEIIAVAHQLRQNRRNLTPPFSRQGKASPPSGNVHWMQQFPL